MCRTLARKLTNKHITTRVTAITDSIDLDGHNVFKVLNNNTSNNIGCLFHDNKVIVDENEMHSLLNKSWGQQFHSKTPPNYLLVSEFLKYLPPATGTPILDFSVSHLKSIIANKKHTSPGRTGTTWKALQWVPDEYLQRLSALFQTCYDAEYKPVKHDHDITVLLPKPNTDPTPDGFRPIMLLSVEYKLYSQVLTNALTDWLHTNKTIPEWQNGATAEKGCDASLWQYLCTIKDAHLSHKQLHALYIDFKKAYDSVEHWVLQLIFNHLNIGKLGHVIMNMLSNTFTNLRVNNRVLDHKFFFEYSVKQGDVISPIFFLLFMAPLMFALCTEYKDYYNPTTSMYMNNTALLMMY